MLYSTASDAVVQHVKSMLAAWPQLDLQLAQSVESQLPAANSWHGSSQGKLAQLEQQLRRQLQPHGLTGLAWQDWQQHPANRKQSR